MIGKFIRVTECSAQKIWRQIISLFSEGDLVVAKSANDNEKLNIPTLRFSQEKHTSNFLH
jgi:hypothetical protein